MASDFDDMQRRAMGILSDASHKVMGKVSLVYQTIKNAYETGDLVDYLTASSVFNALPGTKRNQIGHTAFEQARESVGNAGEPVQALAKLPTPALLTPIVEAMPARPAPPRLAEIKQPEPRPGAPAAGGDRTGTPPGRARRLWWCRWSGTNRRSRRRHLCRWKRSRPRPRRMWSR